MTASHRNVASAFLHRAGLLAGILAVLAGILGMHVITGSHSMHSPAALTAAAGTGAVTHTRQQPMVMPSPPSPTLPRPITLQTGTLLPASS